MKKSSETIVVPHDFTSIGDFALEHAAVISRIMENQIVLLHIVKNASEIPAAEKKCSEIAATFFKKNYIKPSFLVREGSIFNDIGDIAEEVNANLVVMGTHGVKGVQKFTGDRKSVV